MLLRAQAGDAAGLRVRPHPEGGIHAKGKGWLATFFVEQLEAPRAPAPSAAELVPGAADHSSTSTVTAEPADGTSPGGESDTRRRGAEPKATSFLRLMDRYHRQRAWRSNDGELEEERGLLERDIDIDDEAAERARQLDSRSVPHDAPDPAYSVASVDPRNAWGGRFRRGSESASSPAGQLRHLLASRLSEVIVGFADVLLPPDPRARAAALDSRQDQATRDQLVATYRLALAASSAAVNLKLDPGQPEPARGVQAAASQPGPQELSVTRTPPREDLPSATPSRRSVETAGNRDAAERNSPAADSDGPATSRYLLPRIAPGPRPLQASRSGSRLELQNSSVRGRPTTVIALHSSDGSPAWRADQAPPAGRNELDDSRPAAPDAAIIGASEAAAGIQVREADSEAVDRAALYHDGSPVLSADQYKAIVRTVLAVFACGWGALDIRQ